MNARDQFTAVIHTLESSKVSMRCRDMLSALTSLGFEVRDGGKQGHKVVTHDGIPGFFSNAFTCGHGHNPEIKPVYVSNMRKLLLKYESELVSFLETTDER